MHDISGISEGESARDIDRRLWMELTQEQYRLVRELVRLECDAPIIGLLDETERIIAGLEAHLPGLAPVIRLVANHIIETGRIYEEHLDEDTWQCCDRVRFEGGPSLAS